MSSRMYTSMDLSELGIDQEFDFLPNSELGTIGILSCMKNFSRNIFHLGDLELGLAVKRLHKPFIMWLTSSLRMENCLIKNDNWLLCFWIRLNSSDFGGHLELIRVLEILFLSL